MATAKNPILRRATARDCPYNDPINFEPKNKLLMNLLLKFLLLLLLSLAGAAGGYSQKPASAKAMAGKQGQAKIDSALKKLPMQKEDTNNVNLLAYLSYAYCGIDPTEGLKFGQQSWDLAAKLGWEKGIASAFNVIGLNYMSKSDYSNAMEYFSKALALNEKIGNKNGMAAAIGNIGSVYTRQGDYPRALAYLFRALSLKEETGDKKGVASATNSIGILYARQNDNSKALEYFSRSLKLYEELGSNKGIADAFNNMANIYKSQNDNSKALEYYAKALRLSEEMGDKKSIINCIMNIGIVYQKQRNYTEAVDYEFKALKMAEELGYEEQAGSCLGNIGGTYLHIVTDANKAGSIQSLSELPHKAHIPDSLIPQGRSALLHKAVMYLQSAIAIHKKIGALDALQVGYEAISIADSLLSDYSGALEAYKLYTVFKDSVFNTANKTEIMRLGMVRKISVDSLSSAQQRQVVELKYRQQRNYTYLGIAGMMLLVVFSFFIVRERGKSEQLLLNILPAEVAKELKAKGSLEARHFQNVTVLFTDFVNFTSASERMDPQALIDELHTCFKAFDEITSKHNVEKIKTIGDAYLAVAGLPTANPQHAENIVKAATEMNAFMQERAARLGERTFPVRMGIHSGSVVAGIVGVKKFAYDIWGDTVNTAARMEQNCEAGRINISQTTYELVKDKFSFEHRGEIDAKGKGMLKMYYVNG